jgi:hypothetical protein
LEIEAAERDKEVLLVELFVGPRYFFDFVDAFPNPMASLDVQVE